MYFIGKQSYYDSNHNNYVIDCIVEDILAYISCHHKRILCRQKEENYIATSHKI